MNQQNDRTTQTDQPEQNDMNGMPSTPLDEVLQTIDSFIQKGGASKEELMSLKTDLEGIQKDIEGEESGEGESMHKPGGLMIAIGLGKKGVAQ